MTDPRGRDATEFCQSCLKTHPYPEENGWITVGIARPGDLSHPALVGPYCCTWCLDVALDQFRRRLAALRHSHNEIALAQSGGHLRVVRRKVDVAKWVAVCESERPTQS
jgi:hypothetical protein